MLPKSTGKAIILGFLLITLTACYTDIQLEDTKWLYSIGNASSTSSEVDNFLETIDGKFRVLHCRYDNAILIETNSFNRKGLTLDDEDWQLNINADIDNADPTEMELSIQLRLNDGTSHNAGIALAFEFSEWNTENYVMLPASVYNGNRCKIVNRGYAQGLDRKYLYEKDIPIMSVPIPQLSPHSDSTSLLEVNASNLATPAMCFYSKKKKQGFILLAEQETQFADNGFIVEESSDRKKASFVITAPGVREKKPEFIGFSEGTDRSASFNTGDEINLKVRIYLFEASDIPALLDKFMEVRKNVTGPNSPRNLIPMSQTAHWMTERIDSRWYEGEQFQFYCPENANWISFGWIGGLMNTFPMLALNDDMHLERVIKTFDFAIPRAQGKSGYFYGAINFDGKPFGREGYNEFPEIVLTRKNADVLFWMIKQFNLLKAQGKGKIIKPEWEANIQNLADAFVTTWKKNGQWGRMINNQTGEVAEYNTSGGVMAIGGLVLASSYFNNTEYLNVAKESAHFYYRKEYYELGMTTGGCADILQNADSETAAGFMTSLMTLYEITGDRQWLEKSRNLANLCATWTTSYDYLLPEETELGRLDAKLAGVYWASTQNKHGAPGICTSSGVPLFKIYRATGNKLYADLLNDIVHAHAESIRPGGFTNERLTYCDAESRGERGTHVTGWNELNGFLMALEVPGIYLQTDGELFYVFDHVEAKIENHDKHGATLIVSNPTNFDASVSILTESTNQAEISLGHNAFLNWPKVRIQAGESLRIKINSDGNIIENQNR